MTYQEAYDFILPAQISKDGIWADLGAGNGSFAIPLSDQLGRDGKVYAVDLERSVEQIQASQQGAYIMPIISDFTTFEPDEKLDGMLLANALHFVKNQKDALSRLSQFLKPDGCFLFIEYDNDIGNRWVPYPISFKRLVDLTKKLHLSEPVELNRRKSRYGQGEIYLANVCRL